MNIVLIGMRGSGKSTIGKRLAQKLQKTFIETDTIIEIKQRLTVRQIVKKFGWKYFRDIESDVAREVARFENAVIATGGGLVIRAQNVHFLKKNGFFIHLTANIDTLIARIGKDPNRPSLTGNKSVFGDMEEIGRLREKFYQDAADEIIENDKTHVEEVVEIIINTLKRRSIV